MTKSNSLLENNPAELGGCVYYAQNREDLVLAAFFPDVKKGFYVDVGAYDPDEDSVTKLFYLQGWRGVNIEPQPDCYKRFTEERKRDSNLNVGIAQKEGSLKLRTYTSGGLSTFSESVKKDYEAKPDNDTREFKEIEVPVLPLKKVLTEQQVPHINFMKIDVEGFEYEVIASNDWDRFRPEVLCIEANHIKQNWRPLLEKAQYELVFNDNLNDYYVDMKTDRKKHFDFVRYVINDRGGGIRADHFDRLMELYYLARDKSNHVEVLGKEKDTLLKENVRLHDELAKYNSVKFTAKHLRELIARNAGKKKK